MKKILFIALVVVGSLSAASAQERTYTVTPSNTIVSTSNPVDDFLKFYIYQENKTDRGLVLGWSRISKDIPTEWDYSLCDLGTCYPGIPDGDVMDTVPAHEQAFLAINLYPYGVEGTAHIVIAVWDVDNPEIRDTLTWTITAKAQADVVSVAAQNETLRLYPNPAHNRLSINSELGVMREVRIINTLGAEVLRADLSNTADIDVSSLSAGVYRIVLTTDDGKQIASSFVKR